MKLRTKIILTFSMIFIIAFATLSYNAHTTIESSLLSAGLSDELVASILSEVGISTLILSTIIGIGAILVVFWVSSRIALPLRKLDSQLKSQHVGHLLRNIEIERSSIDKDDEISEVVQIINSMINRLNKLELKTQELLAVITHELKTPLAAILGHAQVLQRPKMMGELNPKQQKAIKIINRNVTELKTMIIDLLDSQKLDLEKMRFEYTYVDVTKLMEECESHYQNLLQKKQIQFVNSTKEKISVTTDRVRLLQVFDHLILNAIDFVPNEGGKIEIVAQTKDNDIIFYVKDNGIGISSEKQKEIFKKFIELDTHINRRHGGTGLGLSICKGIINALEGKIWVESEPYKGATFYFSIPKIRKKIEMVMKLI